MRAIHAADRHDVGPRVPNPPTHDIAMKTAQTSLQKDILDELQWEPSLDSSRIGVSIEKGVAVLTGHVRNLVERGVAERAAKRVRGVTAVANELTVDLGRLEARDDADIAKAAVQALSWNVMVPQNRVQVTVSNGVVTLEGEVGYAYQRTAAQNTVEQLTGVKSVYNRLVVKPSVAPIDLRRKLNAALHRYARVEAEGINADVEGSRVVLRGKVHSWAERDIVQEAAWAAPGVSEVDNRLSIEA
jgi:osmotically-inducible protein OsmY